MRNVNENCIEKGIDTIDEMNGSIKDNLGIFIMFYLTLQYITYIMTLIVDETVIQLSDHEPSLLDSPQKLGIFHFI